MENIKQYYIEDIESGELYPCTKEQWEEHQNIPACIMPKLPNNRGQQLVMVSTGATDNGTIYDTFMSPWNNYPFIGSVDPIGENPYVTITPCIWPDK